MAIQETVTVVCDGCGAEHSEDVPVRVHKAKIDARNTKKVDACGECWTTASAPLMELLAKGQPA